MVFCYFDVEAQPLPWSKQKFCIKSILKRDTCKLIIFYVQSKFCKLLNDVTHLFSCMKKYLCTCITWGPCTKNIQWPGKNNMLCESMWINLCIGSQCINMYGYILFITYYSYKYIYTIFVQYETFLYHLKNRIVLSSRRQLESTLCEDFLYVNLNHNNFTFLFHFM